jgi:hypothetical protein
MKRAIFFLLLVCSAASAQTPARSLRWGSSTPSSCTHPSQVFINTTTPALLRCINNKFQPDSVGGVNNQTGTSYTIVYGDKNKLVTSNNSSAVAWTLPQATGNFQNGWTAFVYNLGAGTLTITPTTSTINGSSSLALATGEGATIFSNGTNYSALRTIVASGGSGGVGNVTGSSLTNGQLIKGAGGSAIQVGDLSGDVTTAGGTATTLAAKADIVDSRFYCADAGSNDTYACNLSPAISSYVAGTHYLVKVNTSNTGAATVNLNSVGAKNIKKFVGAAKSDPADNDLRANAIYDFIYDGTDMLLTSLLGNAPSAGASTLDDLTDVTITSPATDDVLKYNGSAWVNGSAPSASGTRPGLAYQYLHAEKNVDQNLTFSTYGLGVSTSTQTTDVTDDDGRWGVFNSSFGGATTGIIRGNGISGAYTGTRKAWTPTFSAGVKYTLDGTQTRIWAGLFSGDPSTSNTPTVSYAAFRYSIAVDGTAFWRTVTDNGSGSPTVTTTTASIATATRYDLRIEISSSDVKFYVDEVLVSTHTTTLPGTSTDMTWGFFIKSTAFGSGSGTTSQYVNYVNVINR